MNIRNGIVPDYDRCRDVMRNSWNSLPESEVIPTHIMAAAARTGQFLVADSGEEIVGFSMSFTAPEGQYLHAIGVRKDIQSRGIGARLMEEAKRQAREQGVDRISLTYHPLLPNNARLYIHKAGGRSTVFEEDAYGKVENASTGGEAPSDRLLVLIDTVAERVDSAPFIPTSIVSTVDPATMDVVRHNDFTHQSYVEIPHLERVKEAGKELELMLEYRSLLQEGLEEHSITDVVREQGRTFYVITGKE